MGRGTKKKKKKKRKGVFLCMLRDPGAICEESSFVLNILRAISLSCPSSSSYYTFNISALLVVVVVVVVHRCHRKT